MILVEAVRVDEQDVSKQNVEKSHGKSMWYN